MRSFRGICRVVAVVLAVPSGARLHAQEAVPRAVTYLDQGWTAEERDAFYYTPQGSQLIPYDWFLHLEKKDDPTLVRDNLNMNRLRFVTRAKSPRNPDGLPVGFVRDADIDQAQTQAKASYLESRFGKRARTAETSWLGLTCAACHTGQVEHGDAVLQVDGAPSMADMQTFLTELAAALEATHRDEAKMRRFADALGGGKDVAALRDEVASHAQVLSALVERNRSTHPYGFARLDAFGAILNAVCDAGLDIPANRVEASAPVSYPFLWDTPFMDWVQWNASANIPLARNVGEVLGVFGFFSLKADGNRQQFDSTVRLRSLLALEAQVAKLKAPAWPEALLGKLDKPRVARGKALFAQNCAACHQVRDADGRFQMVDMAGEPRIRTFATRLQDVKTDPQMIRNLGQAVDPGVLRAMLPPPLAAAPRVPRPELLKLAVSGVTAQRARAEMVPLTPPAGAGIAPPHGGAGYASRSLEGIWATAPYLHNGSVPNLYELLLPSALRSKSFFVGSRKFDPKRVGFVTEASPGAFEFRVANDAGPIPGNSNAGHEGHGAGPNLGYTETFENGAWREFTDDERQALVEYMKSLAPPTAPGVTAAPGEGIEAGEAGVEEVPEQEAAQIANIVGLTIRQLRNRYPGQKPGLRGVHAKDHGCVRAVFEVAPDLDASLRVGVFSEPGRRYDAWIRFSNAATLVLPDDPKDRAGNPTPGSRGMAIKLLGVRGEPLLPVHGAPTQDFLLVNHPVFAFANVEDYEVLSGVVADPANHEDPSAFFAIQAGKGGAAAERAKRTLQIVGKIRAADVAAGAFQAQPASPVDCRYFSGAPFLFGDGAVMKYSAVPVDPPADPRPNVADPNYLRNALIERLAEREGARPVVFQFQVQKRDPGGLDVAREVENASTEWSERDHPFVTVATITIPPQDFDSPERRAECEALVFTPWHGVKEHRPLGGINRLRRAVYEASAAFRHLPKEPAPR